MARKTHVYVHRWQERILISLEAFGRTIYKNFLMMVHCFLWKLMGVVKNKDMVCGVTRYCSAYFIGIAEDWSFGHYDV